RIVTGSCPDVRPRPGTGGAYGQTGACTADTPHSLDPAGSGCRDSVKMSFPRSLVVIWKAREFSPVTTSDKRRFPDLPDVSRDRGDVPRALVLLSVLGWQRE